MNGWEEERAELERERQDKTAKDNRLSLLQSQTAILWNDLKPVLRDAVEKMNTIPDFRRRTGGIVYADGEDKVEVRMQTTLPSVELALARRPTSILLDYSLFKSPRGHAHKPKPTPTLDTDLDDNGRGFFKGSDGAALTIEQAVRQIMRPFIHPELLE